MALLETGNLTHYFGGLRAVYNLNLTIENGELMGLIGPNGAGKTTVFNLLSGFYRPRRAKSVFLAGASAAFVLTRLRRSELRELSRIYASGTA